MSLLDAKKTSIGSLNFIKQSRNSLLVIWDALKSLCFPDNIFPNNLILLILAFSNYWGSLCSIVAWRFPPSRCFIADTILTLLAFNPFLLYLSLHLKKYFLLGDHSSYAQSSRILYAFLRRAMKSGTLITGQLRQPTTSLHTCPITWDIKGCLCLFKHHSPRHTPDW